MNWCYFLVYSLIRIRYVSSKISLHHVVEEGFEHPDAHVHGFVLTDIFAHHATKSSDRGGIVRLKHTLTQRKLKFNEQAHLHRRFLAESRNDEEEADLSDYKEFRDAENELKSLDASPDLSREKVRALALLAFLNCEYDQEEFQFTQESFEDVADVWDASDLYFYNTTSRDEMYSVFRALYDAVGKELSAVSADIGASLKKYDTPNVTNPETGKVVARFEVGVCTLLFRRGNDSILVFRNTVTPGDTTNVYSWAVTSISDNEAEFGAKKSMKRNWIDAGLPWEAKHEDRAQEPDWQIRRVFSSLSIQDILMGSFPKLLHDKINGLKVGGDGEEVVLSAEEASETGYWPVVKAVVDQVRSDLPENGRLLFSGFSQGGGNAQLARMYTEKKYGETWPVISFASVGPACFSRELYGFRGNMLDDVDPTRYYENVTDYKLPLDIYTSYGTNVGDTCILGGYDLKNNLENSRQYKYCDRVYGYSALRMTGDEFIGLKPNANRFPICLHVTHKLPAILEELKRDEELNEDGTTYGGCSSYEGIPLESSGMCPVGMTGLLDTFITILCVVPIGFYLLLRLVTN